MKIIDRHSDPWHRVGGDDGPPVTISPAPHLLLDLHSWHAVRAHWPAGLPVGVMLPNDQSPDDLADSLHLLHLLHLVALHFPKWTDGRAYSQAHLLRLRLGYTGELRATGEVLADMMPLLQRTGFDAVALRPDQKPDVALQALGFFNGHYQADVPQRARTAAGR